MAELNNNFWEKFGITEKDLTNIPIRKNDLVKQLVQFNDGIERIELAASAIPGEGIVKPDPDYIDYLIEKSSEPLADGRVLLFIPASGAASRLFKKIVAFYNCNPVFSKADLENMIEANVQDADYVFTFLENIEEFAFSKDLIEDWKNNELSDQHTDYTNSQFLKFILENKKFNLIAKPKALFEFHHYNAETRTCFEEQLREGIGYSKDDSNITRFHFTVSVEHLEQFKDLYNELILKFKDENVVFDLSFSLQKKSTDTIALTKDRNAARDTDGNLVFRPGGHGALLENLNDLDADFVVIKNIDNIAPDRLKYDSIKYKKMLIGMMYEVEEQVHSYLNKIETGEYNEKLLKEIAEFAHFSLNIKSEVLYEELPISEKANLLFNKLNRPLRICGMVNNEGQVGGGPFWVKDSDGQVTLQIVETVQIDKGDPLQFDIMSTATHFNPVDIVCSVRDYKGNKFNLTDFRDEAMAFISTKSFNGDDILALELPGLWNGGMAFWNTIFVEVPPVTFNPVKEINDLLGENHK